MPAPVTLCRHRLRARAIAAYGRKCICCGESDPRFLTFDHVNGDGYTQRRNERGSSDLYTMLRRLEKAGWPPDVQLMCFNCNCGRSINGGTCPHKDAGRL